MSKCQQKYQSTSQIVKAQVECQSAEIQITRPDTHLNCCMLLGRSSHANLLFGLKSTEKAIKKAGKKCQFTVLISTLLTYLYSQI